MELTKFTAMILGIFLVLKDGNITVAERYVVFPKPFFSSNLQASGEILQTQNIIGCTSWILGNSSRYLFGQTKLTWEDAKDVCFSYNDNAHLVFVESDSENEYIIDVIERQLTASDKRSDVWLGLTYDKQEKMWKWYNRTAVIQKKGPRKITKFNSDENYARITATKSGYEWRDTRCSQKLFFVCEVDV